MSAAVGGWTAPISVFVARLVDDMEFRDRAEADRFAIAIARPLKKEALQAAREVFGPDLKPFRNKGLKARVWDEVEHAPPSIGGGRFILHLYLKPAEAWAVGEYGTRDHLIGMPAGSGSRRASGPSNRTAFGELTATAKRVGRQRKIRPVFLRAPGYMHPVRGPIVVKGTPPKGLIRYAFKRVRNAQQEIVATEWRRYVTQSIERNH